MKCPYCNKIVLGATLVSNTEIRCSYCHHILDSPYEVNFREIVEKQRGICPYCGEFNSDFKPTAGGLICRKCGLVFKISDATFFEMGKGIICPSCRLPTYKFLMLSRNQSICPYCGHIIELPPSIDIPRIALTSSGTCPVCSQRVFHFFETLS